MVIFQSGSCESLKCGVHAALGALAAVCCGYNVIALAIRREPHLAVNSVVYASLLVLEVRKTAHHLEDV